jgi:hypothetical protein
MDGAPVIPSDDEMGERSVASRGIGDAAGVREEAASGDAEEEAGDVGEVGYAPGADIRD